MNIKWVGCHPANFSKGRRQNSKIEAIVVHVMAGTLVGTDAFFAQGRPKAPSSAHYGIGHPWKKPDVWEIHQYVKDEDTSFHAGVVVNPTWKLWKPGFNPNWNTIGIEHEGFADTKWSDDLYRVSAGLIRSLCDKYKIPIDRDHIIGHREVYAVKPCPGMCDLDKLVQMVKEVKVG